MLMFSLPMVIVIRETWEIFKIYGNLYIHHIMNFIKCNFYKCVCLRERERGGYWYDHPSKIAKSDYYLCNVRPSAWNSSASAEWIFVKVDI